MSQFTQQPPPPDDRSRVPHTDFPAQAPWPAQAPQQAQAPRPARGGLGVAALILGIIGTLAAPIPFVFALGTLLGLIALVLGLVGRGRVKRGQATNKGVATTGTVLGVVALLLSVLGGVFTYRLADDVVNSLSTEATSTKTLAARDSAVYEDGLTVTLSTAEPYTPSARATGHTPGNKAYQVTLVIENARTKTYEASDVSARAKAGARGATAPRITDGKKITKGFGGPVPPHRTVTVQLAFDTPPDAKTLVVDVHLGIGHLPSRWELTL